MTDELGRTPISAGLKTRIAAELATLPADKRGAVLVLVDTDTRTARAHLAAKIGDRWKVAAGAAFPWNEPRPSGWIGIEFAF